MTRHLARLADISYRRRGRMVLAWIAATVVIIGVGSSLAGEYNADYNTPGSESKAASELTEERFGGYSGQEIYVVWKDPAGAQSAAAKQRIDAFLAKAQQVDHVAKPTEIRVSQDGKIGSTTLPLTVAGWDVPKEDGEKLIAAAEQNSGDGLQIKLGGDPIYAAQEAASPEGLGFLGAAIVLLIAFGSVVAAGLPLLIALFGLGISSGGLIVLLANVVDVPDWTTAVSGLIGIGVGIDYALLVLTRFRAAAGRGQGSVHDAVVEAVTTAGRSVILAGTVVVISVLGLALTGPALHVRRRHLRLARGPRRDARLGHAAARAPLLPRPEGRPPAAAVPRPRPDEAGGRRGVVRVALEPRRPAPAVDGRDRGDPGPARAGDPRARHAPRLPRRRQRPAEHHDPAGLRPQHRGLRARHQRPARDRRRPAGPVREGEGRRARGEAPQRAGRRLRRADAHERAGQRGAPDRDPEGLPAGRVGRGPRRTGCARTSCPRRSATPASRPRSAA